MRELPFLLFLLVACCGLLGVARPSLAQETAVHRELKPLIYWDTAYSDQADPAEKLFKKRIRRNEFYGYKTKKEYTKRHYRGSMMVELIYVLKEWEEPSEYVENIYWYDTRRNKIRTGPIRKRDKKFAKILHGPYQRLWEGKLLEEGQFYIGTKHGRWMEYSTNKDWDLVNKEKYYKGYYKESLISYLTPDRKKVKEVVPIKDGLKHGHYLLYHDNGDLAVKGQYEFGIKVGTWYEYYEDPRRYPKRKRIIRYPYNYYKRKEDIPYVLIEYDEEGKKTYEYEKAKRDDDDDYEIKRPEDWDPTSYDPQDEEG